MGAGRATCAAHIAYHFPSLDQLAEHDMSALQMGISGQKSISMLDFNDVSVGSVKAGSNHAAFGSGQHRGTRIG